MLSSLKKKKYILDIKKIINESSSLVVLNYNNISSNDLNEFRKKLRKNKSFVLVINNNLFKISILDTKLYFLKKFFSGSIIICYTKKKYGLLSKILYKSFSKYNKKFLLKAVCIKKKLISFDIYKKLSFLFNKKKSLEYLIFYLKNISIIKILRILLFIKNIRS